LNFSNAMSFEGVRRILFKTPVGQPRMSLRRWAR
jgi:hypothetical protein